eukprot:scaffold4507_cov78-Skeletonema_marinoi.AAC.1
MDMVEDARANEPWTQEHLGQDYGKVTKLSDGLAWGKTHLSLRTSTLCGMMEDARANEPWTTRSILCKTKGQDTPFSSARRCRVRDLLSTFYACDKLEVTHGQETTSDNNS